MTNFQLTISAENSIDVAYISTLIDVMLSGSEAELNVDDLLGAIRRLTNRVDAYAKWQCYIQDKADELTGVSDTLRTLADQIDKG